MLASSVRFGCWSDGGRGVVLRLSERVQAIAFVTIVVLAVAGLYAAVQSLQPAAVRPLVIRHARLDVQGEGWSVRYDQVATANNTDIRISRAATGILSTTPA